MSAHQKATPFYSCCTGYVTFSGGHAHLAGDAAFSGYRALPRLSAHSGGHHQLFYGAAGIDHAGDCV